MVKHHIVTHAHDKAKIKEWIRKAKAVKPVDKPQPITQQKVNPARITLVKLKFMGEID